MFSTVHEAKSVLMQRLAEKASETMRMEADRDMEKHPDSTFILRMVAAIPGSSLSLSDCEELLAESIDVVVFDCWKYFQEDHDYMNEALKYAVSFAAIAV